jgi:hypothetical protein
VRSVRFEVSTDLLAELLKLPANAEIVDARSEHAGSVTFNVKSPDLPDVIDPPKVTPTITRTAEQFNWNWNLPNQTIRRHQRPRDGAVCPYITSSSTSGSELCSKCGWVGGARANPQATTTPENVEEST